MFKKEDTRTVSRSSSGILIDRPSWLFFVVGVDYLNAFSHIQLINGKDTSGVVMLDVAGNKFGSDIIVFNIPLFFKDGIYAEFVENGHNCIIQYIPVY